MELHLADLETLEHPDDVYLMIFCIPPFLFFLCPPLTSHTSLPFHAHSLSPPTLSITLSPCQLASCNGRLVIALVTGFSLSMLAVGYLLQRRRRRYRGVSTAHSALDSRIHSRQSSFQHSPNHTHNHTPFHSVQSNGKHA